MERIYKKKWAGYELKESELISHIVMDADDYDYGRLEAMQAKQDKLIDIVSELFMRLPPEVRDEIVRATSSYELIEF